MRRNKFAFNAAMALMIFVAMASFAGTAFAIDVAPVVSLSANSTSVTTSVTLTAVAVDVLDNAGIQWIKIYENGGLLDTKSCGGISSCVFVKVVTKSTPGIFSYYAETQDNGGKTATSGTTVVTFNQPPVLNPIGDQVVNESSLLQFTISATDPGDTLTYSASGLPGGASFNSATQTFTWTPSYTQSGVYPGVTFTVTDSLGLTDSEAISITVNNVNRNPVITSTPVTAGTENVTYSYDVNATDPDGDTPAYALSVAPAGMTINSGSGLISWTPDYTQAGNHGVTVDVTDGIGGLAQQSFTISVANVNRAPTWAATPVDQVITEDSSLSYDVDATDPDLDTILYSVNDTAFSINANGLLTWTPTANWNGVRSIRLTASDGSLFVTADITVTVTGIPDAPVITSTAVTTADEDALYEYDVDASDPDVPYGDTLTFALDTFPAGMTIDPDTGLISWTPDNSQVGDRAVNITVTDGTAASDWQAFTLTVANTNDAPVFVGTIAPQNFDEDGGIPSAFDLDGYFTDDDLIWGDTLTYSVSGNTSVLVTINGDGTVDLSAVGNWNGIETLTFTATDSASDFADSNGVLVAVTAVNDPPYLISAIPDISFDEDAYDDTIDLTAYFADVDDELSFSWSYDEPNITVAFAGNIVNITASANWSGSGTLTFNATEKPGGEYSVWDTITVTVNPVNDAPVIAGVPDQTPTEDVPLDIDVTPFISDVDNVVGDLIITENSTYATVAGKIITFNYPNGVLGETVEITVSDGALQSSQAITVTVTPVNDAPYPITEIPDIAFDEDSYNDSLDMVNYFADVDSVLTYSYSSNESDVTVTFVGTVANITATANWFGTAILSFTASDGEYNVTDDVVITVVNPVPDYAVSIISDSYYQEVSLLLPFVYTITVENTGDTADSYELTVQNLDSADQQAQLNQSSLTLNPTETGQVTLTVSDSNPGVYDVTVTATGNANAVTSTIVTNVTTADTGWVYDSTVNGTPYTSQSTGIWNNVNNSVIQNGSVIQVVGGVNFDADILIVDSTVDSTNVENSWLTGVNATASSINNSILTNCVVINATVKNIVASDCYLADGTYDPPGGGNNLTGSNITNSYTYQSNVTYSNVTYSNITYSNVNNSVIDNSNISYSTVYDSTVRDSTLSWATVINGALITGSQLINSTADNSIVTDSVLTRTNVTDSTVVDSVLTDTTVTSSTLTNVTATNSAISGTTISDVILNDANLTDGVLYSGTITLPDQNLTYNATGGLPLNLSNPAWPEVILSFSPSEVDTNTAVTFTAATSGNFDNGTTLVYEWDFENDGTIDHTSWNSSTALKTYSAEGEYTARVTVADGHGNSASDTTTLTVAYAPRPSKGGGGRGITLPPQDRISNTWFGLVPNVMYEFHINLMLVAFKTITFSVNESLETAQIDVTRLFDAVPAGLENVYQYIEINSTLGDRVRNVEITFEVANSWFVENGLDKTKMKLARYNGSKWEYLETRITSEKTGYMVYKSGSPGLSVFAITTPKIPTVQQPAEPEEPEKPTEIVVSIMPGGSPTFVPINVSGLAVTGITVTPSVRITDVKILAKPVAESDVVATMLADAQQYFELSATSGGETLGDSGIESVKIIFRLSKASLREHNLDASSVRLERWNNGWKSLPTTKVSEDDEYVTYEAVSTGFSLYAIAASAYLHPALVAIIAAAIVVVIAAAILSKFKLLKKRKFWRDGGEPLPSETVLITSEQDNSSLY